MQLKIDPEIRDSIRPQPDAEFKQREENILCDGEVREPLVVLNPTPMTKKTALDLQHRKAASVKAHSEYIRYFEN
jgi:hypothetical protein